MAFSAAVLASSAPLRMAWRRASKTGLSGCGCGLACALAVSSVTWSLSLCSLCGFAGFSIIQIRSLFAFDYAADLTAGQGKPATTTAQKHYNPDVHEPSLDCPWASRQSSRNLRRPDHPPVPNDARVGPYEDT